MAPKGFDWLLERLVGVTKSGDDFPITVLVGGMLVTGKLGSQTEFFATMGEPGAWLATKDSIMELPQPDDSVEHYIHIKDARFLGGNRTQVPANEGVWWRGKLSSVDGFFFGHLAQ